MGLACLCLLVLLVRGETSSAASSKPNVIMFTTDDQTFRDMAVMTKTQALIGNQGASFQHAYASDPLCCPSRVSVQTGEYAHNTGVLGNTPPAGGYQSFNDKNDLPVWLQADGYRTIHIGKMPNGFGEVTNQTYVPPGWGPFNGGTGSNSKGEFYGFLGPPSSYTGFTLDENGADVTYSPDDYSTTVYGDLAVDRINNHLTNFPNNPLYMQVQFFAPHDPATPEPKYANAFATAPLPIDPSFNEKNVTDKPGWIKKIKRFGPGLIAKIQTRYQLRLETLLSVDDAIEKIVNDLQARGALDNTYLIFTSDQGLMQGQHRLHQGKFVAYDPSTQVPLEIRGTGHSRRLAAASPGLERGHHLDDPPACGGQPRPPPGRAVVPPLRPGPGTQVDPADPVRDRAARDLVRARRHRRYQGRAPRQGEQVRQEPRPRPHRAVRACDHRAEVPRNPHRPLPAGQVRGRQPRDV